MCPWWSLCTLYLHARQVRVTAGDSRLCCCTCVAYFKCWLTPLWVDSAWALWASFCFRFLIQRRNSHTQKGIDGYSDGDMENTERISTNLSDSNNMRIKKKIKCACKQVQNSKKNSFFIYINRTSRSIISVNSAFTESTKLPCQTTSCGKLIAVKDLASTLQPMSSGQHPDPQWLAGALWSMSCSRCFLFDPWWPARILWPMSTGQHPLTHNDWLVHFGPCHGAGAVTNGRWPEQVDPSLSTSKCTLTRLTLTHTLGPFHRSNFLQN